MLRGVEQLVRVLDRALQAARTNVILPPFHQRRFKLDRENFLHDRNVFVQQLFLQVDGVSGNNRLLLLLDRKKRGRDEIGERFADAGAGFNHEVALFFQRRGDRCRHRLLFRAILEIARLGEQPVLGKNRPHPLDKIASEGIVERNHDP